MKITAKYFGVIVGILVVGFTLFKYLNISEKVTAESMSVGFVDSEKVVASYPPAVSAYNQLANFRAESQEKLDSKLKEKFGGSKLEELPLEKQKEAEKLFQEDNEQFKKDFEQKSKDTLEPIFNQIRQTIEKIAKQENISVVLEKDTVLYGGADLTEKVINELPKK